MDRKPSDRLMYRFEDVIAFCRDHSIPFITDILKLTAPNAQVLRTLRKSYALSPLPAIELSAKGPSMVAVFESKYGESYHGEVVASIASVVSKALSPDTETLYAMASINPAYRLAFQKESHEAVTDLLENKGIPVFHTSIGWNDALLDFNTLVQSDQIDHLKRISSFIVDSAGNEGQDGDFGNDTALQKHNTVSHVPPLVVRVGAARRQKDGHYVVEGYSAANGPTFVAPVAAEARVKWAAHKDPESIIGTSASAPFASGMLAALNRRFGAYLTREQILYGVITACEKVDRVADFAPKTKNGGSLDYVTTASGLEFNPSFAGFGIINPYAANWILSHMVQMAQDNPTSVTAPEEDEMLHLAQPDEQQMHADGMYHYSVDMPAGLALKTSLFVEFENERTSRLQLKSPAGTALELVTSRDPTGKKMAMTTTHGFAGEHTQGRWEIISPQPLSRMLLGQHRFRSNDLIKQVTPALLQEKRPNLENAKTLTELHAPALQKHHWVAHVTRHEHVPHGVKLNGKMVPSYNNADTWIRLLREHVPPAFSTRHRVHTPIRYNFDEHSPAGKLETEGNVAYNRAIYENGTFDDLIHAADCYEAASREYHAAPNSMGEANTLSLAAQSLLAIANPDTVLLDRRFVSERAADLLEQAIAKHVEMGHVDHAYRDCDLMHRALCDAASMHARHNNFTKVNVTLERIAQVQEHALRFARGAQGVIDADAHRIEEGEAGFSCNERIGTDNVSQCITVIARDPVTHKTGLVHIDHENDLESLDEFFDQIGSRKLEVKLIGARFDQDARSRENIVNVMKALNRFDVNILSADIYGGDGGPSTVVVDPKTFALTEAVPGKENPNYAISNAHLLFTEYGKSIKTQFDFDITPQRAPILLDRNAVEQLRRHYLGKSVYAIEEEMRQFGVCDRSLIVPAMRTLCEAYEMEYGKLHAVLIQQCVQHEIPLHVRAHAEAELQRAAIYVGENAGLLNQPLKGILRNGLIHGHGASAECDTQVIEAMRLGLDPYEQVARKYGESVMHRQRRDEPQTRGRA